MLKVKKLDPRAILPTVANPGDLAYDLYALEDTVLEYGEVTKVRTGIAAQAMNESNLMSILSRAPDFNLPPVITPYGLLIRDRSSVASKGIVTSGGVIDSGYTGEISVLMTNNNPKNERFDFHEGYYKAYQIKAGDKIAQIIPIPVLTGQVVEVEELGESSRGDKGFGSSGQ